MSPVVARQGTRSVLPETIPTNRLGLQKIAGCENSVRLMDIVFIHGLDGDAWASWMADPADTKTFWPYWLAEAFPRAGIWSLGYPAASLKWKEDAMPIETRAVQVLSLMALDQIGERPLVMVTHSMGGLLAKQMLRVASELQKPAYQQIARQTKSIAFISTPHSGSKLANFMTFFGFIARPNEQLVELTAHKAYLRSLHTWFLSYQKAHELVCLTYCETREVRVKRRPLSWLKKGLLVVDQGSADTGIPDEPPIPLDEDHISICKPASRSAQLYRGLVALLESCQARLAKTTAE
jgi:pimeloyl-ACP methyl ester carboxylesterase